MNAATDSFARNPFAGLSSGAGAGAAGAAEPNPQQGSENRDPLPNPWAPAGGAGGRAGAAAGAGASGAAPNVLNTPAMQSLMQQMSENPAIMQNLLDAPYTRTMMESMAADPAMAANVSVCLCVACQHRPPVFVQSRSRSPFVRQLINQSPLLANNPQLQDQMRTMMPQFLQQMQNPEVQAMMTNPQALNAIMQIQQGMEQLRSAAPGLVNSMGIPAPLPGVVPPSATTATTTTPASGTGAMPNLNAAPANQALFSDFMSRMMNGMAAPGGLGGAGGAGGAQLPPEERYSSQLEHLSSMGFVNREANIQGEWWGQHVGHREGRHSTNLYVCSDRSSDRHVW